MIQLIHVCILLITRNVGEVFGEVINKIIEVGD